MNIKTCFFILFCFFNLSHLSAKQFADPRETFEITMGTANPSGLYYTFGSTLSSIISKPPGLPDCRTQGYCGIPGLVSHTTSTKGSLDNLTLLNTGKIGTALVQADVFKSGNYPHVYVIMPLYPEILHVIVRHDASFKNFHDLRGKKVAFGNEGSGTFFTVTNTLKALGLSINAFKNQKHLLSNALDELLKKNIDAVCIMAGTPLPVLQDLIKKQKIKLLSLSNKDQKHIIEKTPYIKAYTLSPSLYIGMKAIQTISTQALWVTAERTSKNLAYDFLWSYGQEATKRILDRTGLKIHRLIHEDALTREMLKDYKDKLHPGALSYHRKRGII